MSSQRKARRKVENSTSDPSADASFTSLSDQSSPNYVTFRRATNEDTLNPLRNEFREFQESITNQLEKWFTKQETMMARVLNEFEEFKKSVNFMSEKYEELNNKTTQCISDLCILKKRVDAMENQAKNVGQLEAKIEYMEQQSRQCNVEISNIPERRNENLVNIVEVLGSAVKQTITSDDIVSIHRVPHADAKSAHPKNIILKLSSRILRDNVLSAVRMMKGLYTDTLQIGGERRKIYVNEHLTLKNKQLFRRARELAKNNHFRFVWVKHGCVLVRECETSHVIAIRTCEDLSKITTSKKSA